MNSDQDIKMFSKEVAIAADASAFINLLDTAGNFMACDYIEIDTNLLTHGFYQVIPSGVTLELSAAGSDNYSTNTSVSATTAAGNGAPGWVGITTKTLKISLPWANRTSRLWIRDVSVGTTFYIRYGMARIKNQSRRHSGIRSAEERGT